MAGPDSETACADYNEIVTILASEGVKFLISGDNKVPLSSCDGKMVCLLFSANRCRPCKTFIPQLVQLYENLKTAGQKIEIIFISFDEDENGFKEQLKSMPWLAVPFCVDLQIRLSDHYHVDRIPSLMPLGLDRLTVDEDPIGLIEDYGAEAYPFTRKRREELKAIDTKKREEGKLDELLAHEGRDYVISRDGEKVQVSELAGKTIGLYFGAHWCPPSRAFTAQLTEVYNQLKGTKGDQFEVIFVSTDRDHEEFDLQMVSMPWLAIPYKDKCRGDLCRIFNIKGIPALVLIGPDGKIISKDGRTMISLYGFMAFPFTDSRIREIEATIQKEGNLLPQHVTDIKHEHALKLDRAKTYVCDLCKKQGRFWAFSCDVCDYDLHPTCLQERF